MATGDDPIVATAIHAGHSLRPEVEALTTLSDAHRLREEDPFTDRWIGAARNALAVGVSRFEVDLNRPRDKAVYVTPEDAWGLDLWKTEPSLDMVGRSLEIYDRFYEELGQLCDRVIEAHGHVVVLDIHSYNHRRNGADAPVDDPELNPEINLGTESIAASWDPVVSRFATTVSQLPFDNDTLDVRTNVRFRGGNMPRWINARYQDRGCAIAIEVKKIFMDEWSGALDEGMAASIGNILTAAAETVRQELRVR